MSSLPDDRSKLTDAQSGTADSANPTGSTKYLTQALAPAAVLILGLVLYTGFTLPTKDMLG
jgi:hypothetical protein